MHKSLLLTFRKVVWAVGWVGRGFSKFILSNFIKQDLYVLHTKHHRSFFSTSQSSDELIFQVMVIARNKTSR